MGVEGDRDVINAESEQARLRSEGGRGAAAWLRAIPSSYHTKVPNLHMRVMLQFWLGTIIPVLAVAPRECDCHWLRERGPDGGPGLADLRGRHDMVCTNTSGDKLRRHNYVLVAVRAALSLLNIFSSMCNVLGIAQRGNQPANQKQPDLAIFDFHRGGSSPTLLDAVFTDPTASSYRRNASRSVGSASARAERRKVEYYRDQAIAAGYRFKAFGIDVFGAWGVHGDHRQSPYSRS